MWDRVNDVGRHWEQHDKSDGYTDVRGSNASKSAHLYVHLMYLTRSFAPRFRVPKPWSMDGGVGLHRPDGRRLDIHVQLRNGERFVLI